MGGQLADDFGLNVNLATFRTLDPATGRWWQVDPKAELMYGMTPYNSMAGNPIRYTDPEGDFIPAMLIGAAIGVATNGIGNAVAGNNFFQGAGQAALFGAIGGGVSFGIGQAASGLSGIGKAAFQAGAHGLTGGAISEAQGGSFGSGFLSGALSSGISSGAGALGIGNVGMIGVGGLSGGLGSAIGGGSFWMGARQGLITSGLNHAAHTGAFGEGLAASLQTGKIRHWFTPDATGYSISADGFAGGGVGLELGRVIANVGQDKGIEKTYFEVGIGGGLEGSASTGPTTYYYSGKSKNFRLSMLAGRSQQVSISGSYFGVFGGNLSFSDKIGQSGHRIYGYGLAAGVGLPTIIAGSWQKRLTVLSE